MDVFAFKSTPKSPERWKGARAARHIRQGSFGLTQTPMKESWGGNEGGCCSVVICSIPLMIKHPLHFKKLGSISSHEEHMFFRDDVIGELEQQGEV